MNIISVSRGSVFAWQKAYREGGLAALSTKFASGRPMALTDEQMMRVYTWIVGSDPRQHTFGFALWTRQLVRDLIVCHFRVRLSLPTVGRILRKLGLSPQRPLYRAWQQDAGEDRRTVPQDRLCEASRHRGVPYPPPRGPRMMISADPRLISEEDACPRLGRLPLDPRERLLLPHPVDASVVACAERLGIDEVATVDRRHFTIVKANRQLVLLP